MKHWMISLLTFLIFLVPSVLGALPKLTPIPTSTSSTTTTTIYIVPLPTITIDPDTQIVLWGVGILAVILFIIGFLFKRHGGLEFRMDRKF